MADNDLKGGGGEMDSSGDHSADGSTGFNPNAGGEERPAAPVTDAKNSEVKEDADAEEAFFKEYQSIKEVMSKISDLLAEVQCPVVAKAAVRAKAYKVSAALSAALYAAAAFDGAVEALKYESSMLARISDFEKLKVTVTELEEKIADLEKLGSGIRYLEARIAGLEKMAASTFDSDSIAALKLKCANLAAKIPSLAKPEAVIHGPSVRIATLEKSLAIPQLKAKIAVLEEQEYAIMLLDARIDALEVCMMNVDAKAKSTALKKLEIELEK